MFLTILTPTYNRVHTLDKLYKSLLNQTFDNFNWLIVDDGSTDDTARLVDEFIRSKKLNISYLYKTNGGKHSAVNLGIENISTELVFIVDSDDYLTCDAVEIIYDKWVKYKNKPDIASFWFLQKNNEGDIIGDIFPYAEYIGNYVDVMINGRIKGDKKSVYYTDVRKKFLFPEFKNENFIGESTIHKRISTTYNSVFINIPIYISEYLIDGLTHLGLEMRINNPLGGIENSKEFLTRDVNFFIRVKKMILYNVYSMIAKKRFINYVRNSGYTALSIVCYPVSYIIYLRWSNKYL